MNFGGIFYFVSINPYFSNRSKCFLLRVSNSMFCVMQMAAINTSRISRGLPCFLRSLVISPAFNAAF